MALGHLAAAMIASEDVSHALLVCKGLLHESGTGSPAPASLFHVHYMSTQRP